MRDKRRKDAGLLKYGTRILIYLGHLYKKKSPYIRRKLDVDVCWRVE